MKHISTILSVLALVISIVLAVVFFNEKHPERAKANTPAAAAPQQTVKIAYFDIDSLENNYEYFKDQLAIFKKREDAMTNELSNLERSYQKKISEWQQKGSTMSQSESEAVQREYAQMQQTYQSRKQALEQSLADQSMSSKKDIKEKIEEFLKVYNKDREYAYIFSYVPEMMFYKDTVYNITNDMIRGLNEGYKKK
jgi:outer membrane protein